MTNESTRTTQATHTADSAASARATADRSTDRGANGSATSATAPLDVGVVVIGRNEGERLRRCLHSLIGQQVGPMVYVDSGSTDGSVELARRLGVEVVALDTSLPFTMARGRNAGFQRLHELHPELSWVQFVDGDCEVDTSWIAQGRSLLQARSDVVAVCGFRKERHPEVSIYNQLIDLEWQGPVGEIGHCGGDAMYRVGAFLSAGGFREEMIAGEEPELCVRLRSKGGVIFRLDVPMTVHDADMTRFWQWWRRAVRCGHAYAEGYSLHGRGPMHHNQKQLRSSLILGAALPVACGALALTPIVGARSAASLVALAAYAKSARGAFVARRALGNTREEAALYSGFVVLAKFPEALGIAKYYLNAARGRRSALIEYNTPAVTTTLDVSSPQRST